MALPAAIAHLPLCVIHAGTVNAHHVLHPASAFNAVGSLVSTNLVAATIHTLILGMSYAVPGEKEMDGTTPAYQKLRSDTAIVRAGTFILSYFRLCRPTIPVKCMANLVHAYFLIHDASTLRLCKQHQHLGCTRNEEE